MITAEDLKLLNPAETKHFCGRSMIDGLRQNCQPEVKKIILEMSEAVEINTATSIVAACCKNACTLKKFVQFCSRKRVGGRHVQYDVEK